MCSIVVAYSQTNRVIGKAGGLPWHLPADLGHFKKLTLGRTILMGRVTAEAIQTPLPGRRNLVLTRKPDIVLDKGFEVISSLDDAFDIDTELMIIGGGAIYHEFLPYADRLYLTEVEDGDDPIEGDTYFPKFDESNFRELTHGVFKADSKNAYSCNFRTLVRKVA